jgi:hypothetical protein
MNHYWTRDRIDTFTFDTSGEVVEGKASDRPRMTPIKAWRWEGLDTFTQAYVAALFEAEREVFTDEGREAMPGFSDLAPETLATILRDCEAARRRTCAAPGPSAAVPCGRSFWSARQAGRGGAAFPPLSAYVGDDGRVYLLEGRV